MTLWAVKTSKLAMYLGQEDTQGYGFTASPSPPFLWQSSTSVLPWLPDQGQGCRGSRQAGGPGKAEDSNRKEPTGAQRTERREMGVVRGPPPVFLNQQNSGRATFLNCNSGYAGSGEWHAILENKGELLFHTGDEGAGGTAPDAINSSAEETWSSEGKAFHWMRRDRLGGC